MVEPEVEDVAFLTAINHYSEYTHTLYIFYIAAVYIIICNPNTYCFPTTGSIFVSTIIYAPSDTHFSRFIHIHYLIFNSAVGKMSRPCSRTITLHGRFLFSVDERPTSKDTNLYSLLRYKRTETDGLRNHARNYFVIIDTQVKTCAKRFLFRRSLIFVPSSCLQETIRT